MKTGLFIVQIIIALVLIFLIVIQSKGTGIDSSLINVSSTYSTKRGLDKIVFYLTIAFAALFFISSIVQLAI